MTGIAVAPLRRSSAPHRLAIVVCTLCGLVRSAAAAPAAPEIKFVRHDDQQRIDVLVAGQPFTSYRWAPALKKPVLFPIRAADGTLITRGWPVEPRPGEPTDHPHHVGLWLSYGDVGGVDFWGHSEKNSSPDKGVTLQRAVKSVREGRGSAALEVTCDWVMPDHTVALAEATHYGFSAGPDRRVIDRTTTLTATRGRVGLPDNKEGLFGLRLDHALEHPGPKNPTATGHYRSSEGVEGEAVWGTRGRWLMLSARTPSGAPLTIAILDHPSNPGFPTHWHARPWGLFAANPLGQKALSGGKETLGFALAKGGDTRFAYRVAILSRQATPAEIEDEYQRFVAEVK